MKPITYHPIGIVHSPYKESSGTPIQPYMAPDVVGTVEILPEYAEGLKDIEGFSHIYLICHLDRTKAWTPHVVPYLETEERGIFACRSPARPNSIGLSLVRLIERKSNILRIAEIDILDGTPVLDVKPFVSDFDTRSDTQTGWYERIRKARKKFHTADDRFEDKIDES